MTIWPSGLRRQLQVLVRKGVGSNPTVVTYQSVMLPTFCISGKILRLTQAHHYGNTKVDSRLLRKVCQKADFASVAI